MNIKKLIKTIFIISSFTISSSVVASGGEDLSTAFVCTPEEMVNFLEPIKEMQEQAVKIPSNKEIIAANIEMACLADPSSQECVEACFNMPNFAFPDVWKEAVDLYNQILENLPSVSSGGQILDNINKAFGKAKKEIMDIFNTNVCELVDFDDLKSTMGDYIASNVTKVIDTKYDFNINNVDSSTRELLFNQLKEKYGSDAEYFFDPDKYPDDLKEDALNELKKEDKKFWEGM
jgi:hypothetical protein